MIVHNAETAWRLSSIASSYWRGDISSQGQRIKFDIFAQVVVCSIYQVLGFDLLCFLVCWNIIIIILLIGKALSIQELSVIIIGQSLYPFQCMLLFIKHIVLYYFLIATSYKCMHLIITSIHGNTYSILSPDVDDTLCYLQPLSSVRLHDSEPVMPELRLDQEFKGSIKNLHGDVARPCMQFILT